MMMRKVFLAILPFLFAAPALAEDYPTKSITIIVPFTPGGGTDNMSRLVGKMLSESTGWNVLADNRAGAGGTIGLAAATRAKPDGYELVMGQADNLAVAPWLYKSVTYNPVKDFTPIVNVAATAVVIATRADSKYKTLDDVIQAAKASPNSIDYASPGTGTTVHLTGELLQNAAGIKMQHIPYKGSAPAMADLLGGQVPLAFTSIPSAYSQLKAGTVRALAVTSAQRSSILPDVPTVAELGYKDFNVAVWYGLLAPANTPEAIVKRVNEEVNKILATTEMKEAMNAQGAEPIGGTPEAFAATIKADYDKWGEVVKAAGVQVN